MNERELVELIDRALGRADKPDADRREPKPREDRPSGAGRAEGFAIDTDALTRYARRTGDLADELRAVGRKKVGSIKGIAEDSFGKIGKESGFAGALTRFADALEHQVVGVADNADKLGRAVNRTAAAYRREDAEIAADLTKLA